MKNSIMQFIYNYVYEETDSYGKPKHVKHSLIRCVEILNKFIKYLNINYFFKDDAWVLYKEILNPNPQKFTISEIFDEFKNNEITIKGKID